jgi:hypothetical protein
VEDIRSLFIFCLFIIVVYYESIKRKVQTKYIWGCRCYERLQPNTKEFTRLAYTELVLELEYRSSCQVFFFWEMEEKKNKHVLSREEACFSGGVKLGSSLVWCGNP